MDIAQVLTSARGATASEEARRKRRAFVSQGRGSTVRFAVSTGRGLADTGRSLARGRRDD